MTKRIAVLIDADNVSATHCSAIFNRFKQLGTLVAKRAYGDFTAGSASQWHDCVKKHAISAKLNLSVANGKNAADISLAIDAVELLHTGNIDVFCLVSSDSDFTPIAIHLREHGKLVIGLGEEKTPDTFQAACHQFTILDKPAQKPKKASPQNKSPAIPAGYDLILSSLKELGGDQNWIGLSPLGKKIKDCKPDFRYSEHGGNSLKKIVSKMANENRLVTSQTEKMFRVRLPRN